MPIAVLGRANSYVVEEFSRVRDANDGWPPGRRSAGVHRPDDRCRGARGLAQAATSHHIGFVQRFASVSQMRTPRSTVTFTRNFGSRDNYTGNALMYARRLGSKREQDLDGAAFIHRGVTFCRLVQRQGEIEDLAGIDLSVPDQLDQLG
jgi:hypothetical protein